MLEPPEKPGTDLLPGTDHQPSESRDRVDLRLLIEDCLDGAVLIVDDRVRYANHALFEMTGYTDDETRRRPITDFFAPRDRDRFEARKRALLKGGPTFASEYELLRKDGTTRLVEVRSRTIDFHGKPALLSIVRDLFDRQEIEQRLRASEERYRALFEDNPSMYFILDGRGVVLSVNKFGAAQLGYSPEELVGQDVLGVFLEEDRAEVREQVGRCLAREGGVDYWEFRKVRKDGSILWVSECARAVRDPDGNPLLLVVCEDITKRKRVEEVLQNRQSQLRVLSELTSDCCWTREEHPDGRIERQWVTGSFRRLTGYDADEFDTIGRAGLVHPEDLSAAMQFIHGPQGKSEHEFRIVRKDGTVRHLRERLQIEKRNDGVIYAYGATRDITEEKEAESALQASRERLNQSERLESLGRLAGGIAHDFNNLLMVIIGYSEQLLSGTDEGSRPRRYASEIRRAGERASSLTKQLLAFSRKQALQPRTVELSSLVSGMREMLQRLVPEDIELIFDLAPGLGAVKIDPRHFERALMNLVVNAADAIESNGEIRITTTAGAPERIRARRDAGTERREYVGVQVADNGRGMDAETQKFVFEPFFTTKTEGRGTGLGMAAVYGTVTQSDGEIEVRSKPDTGTTVSIYLPVVEGPATSSRDADSPQRMLTGSETLLLVEDESMVREMIGEALADWGYTVLEAACPSEALRICSERAGTIDLMITDVVMPEMDGKRLAERVTAERPETRVLFMSGYPSEFVGRRGVVQPDVSLLTKPISLELLNRKIRELLEAP